MNRCLMLDAEHHLTLIERAMPEPGPDEALIKIAFNGICGSDVHFYKEGRLGNFVVSTPYVPGHECSGTVERLGERVKRLKMSDRVVIEPGIACGVCGQCKSGRYNLCHDVVFLSAPPIDGTFCDYVCARADFVHVIPNALSLEHAALVEPAAVAVHAVNRARFENGATGVILGAGPIGLLTLQAFKAAGGGRAICVDVIDERLALASRLGADQTCNPRNGQTPPDACADVVFETAGNDQTTAMAFSLARAGGRCVQVGWPASNHVSLDVAGLMEKEIDYMGVNRYANAYPAALAYLADGRINAELMISHRFPLEQAPAAFDQARDKPAETIKIIVRNG